MTAEPWSPEPRRGAGAAPTGLDALLRGHAPQVAETTRELCRFVQEVVSGAGMHIDDGAVHFGLAHRLCTVAPTREHVRLLFPRGDELDDPDGLLHGTGAARHVDVRSFAHLDHERAVRWLNQAEAKAK